MITLYDATGTPHPITDYDDYSITHMLDGCDELSFSLDVKHEQYPLLYEEARVVAHNNEWLIKKIDDDRIDCALNFDFLKTRFYKDYKSETLPLVAVLQNHLPNGWSIIGGNVSSISRTIEFDFCTDYDVVYQCMSTYGVYFVWNIPEKKLHVFSKTMMQSTGEYLTNELNLRSLSFKGDTTSFITRMYAFGKGGMTMEDAIIEGQRYGLQYVDNREYVDKTVIGYWTDERYTVPESLYNAAVEKMKTLAMPVRSYECNVVDLAKQNPAYSFLDFSMHKKITLIDTDRGIRVEHQIVEYKEYPDEPIRNVVTLSCVAPTIKTAITNAVSTMDDYSEKMKTAYDERIQMATAMLTGAFGGYVQNIDGELFILDNEDPDLAQTVWRWNINGFGKSSTGIEGPYTTAITFDDNFITSVITAMVIRGAYIEAGSIQTAALSQQCITDVTSEVTGDVEQLQQEFTVMEGEVNSKISYGELGTQIQQNYESVRLAWNNISQYFSFETSGGYASLNIYDSGGQNLLTKFDYNGSWFYRSGTTIGKIGTNSWSGDANYRGLVFDLEASADYMAWAQDNGSYYDVKLGYFANSIKYPTGFHFWEYTYVHSNAYFDSPVQINDNLSMYSDIDMNGYDILNQSDARLKKNIKESEVDALSIIDKIQLYEYDWIETEEHCGIGFVAQQMQKAVPDLVTENAETGKMSIKTTQIIPYLLKAIQEMNEKINGGTKGKKAKWTDRYKEKTKTDFVDAIRKHHRLDKLAASKESPKFENNRGEAHGNKKATESGNGGNKKKDGSVVQ